MKITTAWCDDGTGCTPWLVDAYDEIARPIRGAVRPLTSPRLGRMGQGLRNRGGFVKPSDLTLALNAAVVHLQWLNADRP